MYTIPLKRSNMKHRVLSLVCISLSFLYCFGAEPLRVTQIRSNFAGCNRIIFPGTLLLTLEGGTPPYFYAVNGNGPTEVTGNLISFKGNPGQYQFSIVDSGNPQESVIAIASIKETPPTRINSLSIQNNACSNDSNGRIMVGAEGGTPPLSYAIGGGTFGSSNTFSNLRSDLYRIRVSDAGLCPVANTAVQVLPTVVRFNTNFTRPTCTGGSDATISISVPQGNRMGGVPPFQFSVDDKMTFQKGDTPTSKLFSGLKAGVYCPFVKDANDCLYPVETITIPELSDLSISLMISNVTTNGGNDGVIIVVPDLVTPRNRYSLNGGEQQDSPVFEGLFAGTYTVTTTIDLACFVAVGVVTEPQQPLNFTTTILTQPSCKTGNPGTLHVKATGGTSPYSYSIDAGKTFQLSPDFTNLKAGEYIVVVRDSQNTTVTHTATVGVVIKLTGNSAIDCIIKKCCKHRFKYCNCCVSFVR